MANRVDNQGGRPAKNPYAPKGKKAPARPAVPTVTGSYKRIRPPKQNPKTPR